MAMMKYIRYYDVNQDQFIQKAIPAEDVPGLVRSGRRLSDINDRPFEYLMIREETAVSDKQLRDQGGTSLVSQVDQMNRLREKFLEYCGRNPPTAAVSGPDGVPVCVPLVKLGAYVPRQERGDGTYYTPEEINQLLADCGKALKPYIPQEYPKMVPGPNGPVTVQGAEEEYIVLKQRVMSMGMTLIGPPDHAPKECPEPDYSEHMLGDPEWCPNTATAENVMPEGITARKLTEYKVTEADKPTESDIAKVFGNKTPIEPLNVELWLRDRKAQDHDWIGALYRPYEPPV